MIIHEITCLAIKRPRQCIVVSWKLGEIGTLRLLLHLFRDRQDLSRIRQDPNRVHLLDDLLILQIVPHQIPNRKQSMFTQICHHQLDYLCHEGMGKNLQGLSSSTSVILSTSCTPPCRLTWSLTDLSSYVNTPRRRMSETLIPPSDRSVGASLLTGLAGEGRSRGIKSLSARSSAVYQHWF